MKAISIAGRTTKNCEVQTYEGREFITFSVAVETYQKKQKGVMFFECTYYRTGLAPHMPKGTPVAVSGEFVADEYNGKTYLKVRASEVTLLGSARKEETASNPEPAPPQHENTTSQDMDDEIPF
jgi:single-strand DNA-binding protein